MAHLTFHYDDRQLWLEELDAATPLDGYDLCRTHANRVRPPVGWNYGDPLEPDPVPLPPIEDGEAIAMLTAALRDSDPVDVETQTRLQLAAALEELAADANFAQAQRLVSPDAGAASEVSAGSMEAELDELLAQLQAATDDGLPALDAHDAIATGEGGVGYEAAERTGRVTPPEPSPASVATIDLFEQLRIVAAIDGPPDALVDAPAPTVRARLGGTQVVPAEMVATGPTVLEELRAAAAAGPVPPLPVAAPETAGAADLADLADLNDLDLDDLDLDALARLLDASAARPRRAPKPKRRTPVTPATSW